MARHHALHAHLHAEHNLAKRDPQADVATVYSIVYVTANPLAPLATAVESVASSAMANLGFGVAPSSSTSAPAFLGFPVAASSSSAAPFLGFPAVSSSSAAAFIGFGAVASSSASSSHALSTSTAASSRASATSETPLLIQSSSSAALLGSPLQSTSGGFIIATSTSPSASATQAQNNAAKTSDSAPMPSGSTVGLSGAAKAGLALGIVGAIIVLVAFVWLFDRRRRQTNAGVQKIDDEKPGMQYPPNSLTSHVSVRRQHNNAPRLSLRPLTQMFPGMGANIDEKQAVITSDGFLAASTTHNNRSRSPNGDRAVSPAMQHAPAAADAVNPFEDQMSSAQSDLPAVSPTQTSGPVEMAADIPTPILSRAELPAHGAEHLQSMTSLASSSNSQSTSRSAPSRNVHRVHIDFTPSMDDELELKVGSLALCVRLDRSQQGVCPRTCLSKLPVKPRPAGPPQGMRGPPPHGRRPHGPPGSGSPNMRNGPSPPRNMNGYGPGPHSRRYGDNSSRARSHSNGTPPQYRRPMSPGMHSSGSPRMQNYQQRPRSNSEAAAGSRRINSQGSDSSNSSSNSFTAIRKPIPGQAM
ncbi:hypothetical protein MRB53_038511 [Persea americana]|nr:hypothetical protein MRB53_038511 [Persea americana]